MSVDPTSLQALAVRTKAHLRYFELVNFRAAGHDVWCFLGVGKHALYLIRRNLGGLYPSDEGGEIYFALIRSMVEDSENTTDIALVLSEAGSMAWKAEKLLVSCENRHALAQRIQVAWNTDYIFRFGQVRHLHLVKHPLSDETRKEQVKLTVKPFKGCKQVLHHSHRFFVANSYQDQDHAGHLVDQARMLDLEIVVQEPVPIANLESSSYNHIRWVALEYKQSVTLNLSHVVVIRSAPHRKRTNFNNDICAWTGWELIVRSSETVLAVLLLRRQYVPPLADCAQDFCIRVSSPRWVVEEGKVDENLLLHEARMIADSTMPDTSNCTIPQQMYRDFIQAKLDALVFPISALSWAEKSLGLKPTCEREARGFLKACLVVLGSEYQLSSVSLPDELGQDVPAFVTPQEAVHQVARSMPRIEAEEDGEVAQAENAWLARVAKYFTYCLDGVLLPGRFDVSHICKAVLVDSMSQSVIQEVLLFMLHIRPKDWSRPWENKEIKKLLLEPDFFEEYEFNDHAMQALLECGWLAKQLKPPKEQEKLSWEFSQFLAKLLVSPASSVDLKAAICRTVIASCSGPMHLEALVPAILSSLQQRNIHLKAYATVTLVNIVRRHEPVKEMVLSMDAPAILAENLGIKDDDLIYYTLMLITNLTKSTAHRFALKKSGVVSELLQLLRIIPLMPGKGRLLEELASSIGQLCNDEDIWVSLSEQKVVERLLQLHVGAPSGGLLRARIMFALRQFSFGGHHLAAKFREEIGHSLPVIIKELKDITEERGLESANSAATDCAVNSVLLLHTLAISPKLVEEMRELGLGNILMKLRFSPLSALDAVRERLAGLWDSVNGTDARQ